MSPEPRPPQQGPYLSTEDIVARVRAAQGKSRLFAFRGVLVVLGGLLVVAALIFNLRHVRQAENPTSQPVGQGPAETAPAAEPISPPSTPGATSERDAKSPLLRVIVKGRAGIITLDGKRVTVDRHWSSSTLFGRHVIGVRCGSVSLRRSIQLQGSPITLIFDCAARKIEQT